MRLSALLWPGAAVAVAVAMLIPIGIGDIEDLDVAAGGKCGEFNIAVNNWVGYAANAYVIGEIAEKRLGCRVNYVSLDEQTSWQGFASGDVDAIVENWGHPDLKKLYIDELGVAQKAGKTGNKGVIGWWVPPWMAKKYPDITNWKNLNKYADMFQTSESGDEGQLLDGSPAFVTNDEALVENLKLDYKVVYAGSETALIQAFRQAQQNKEPMIGYFYSPQWFLAEVPLVQVQLPKYTEGCDADPEKVDCEYPPYDLDKVVSTDFADSGSSAYDLVKNFHWTDDDQNTVAKYIAVDGMSNADAAQKWIDDNPDQVKDWLPAS